MMTIESYWGTAPYNSYLSEANHIGFDANQILSKILQDSRIFGKALGEIARRITTGRRDKTFEF